MSRFFLPLLIASAMPLHAALLKLADFETGDVTQLRIQQGSPDAVTLVTSPVRAGKYAAKMLLRATDPEVAKGQRAEFTDDRTKIQMDTEYWYGLSLYLPGEFKAPQKRDAVLFQWHTQQGGPSPVLAIRVQGDEWVITSDAIPGGKRRRMKRLPMQKDVWTDWVVHVRWASDTTGFWSIWKDGVEVINEKDIITQYPEKLGPYAKFGQYHSVEETDRNVIYADEYRVAGPEGSYEMVAPPKAR
ncbi:polysaccharide lyase [Prosthecobacter fusiformis]|nr:polysaccharide lyase [Prosthecobacter fusiformis]